MRVRASSDIIEADFHKGDRTLARKGAFGTLEFIQTDQDRPPQFFVRFDHMPYDRLILERFDIEPAGLLDQLAWEARDDG